MPPCLFEQSEKSGLLVWRLDIDVIRTDFPDVHAVRESMAKKSKTQRAKASAARQAKKEAREREDNLELVESDDSESDKKAVEKAEKKSEKEKPVKAGADTKKSKEEKPKKKRFQFFRDVKAEMKRVTWPSRVDVMRWTGVVAVALVFFGIFVAVLDNLIITPLMILISGADPASIDWMSVFTGGDNFDASSASSDASSADVSSGDAGSVDASSDAQSADQSQQSETSTEGE